MVHFSPNVVMESVVENSQGNVITRPENQTGSNLCSLVVPSSVLDYGETRGRSKSPLWSPDTQECERTMKTEGEGTGGQSEMDSRKKLDSNKGIENPHLIRKHMELFHCESESV